MPLPQVCVCYLLRERAGVAEVLLGRKKHGLGMGYFVGLGGKLEPGQSTPRCARCSRSLASSWRHPISSRADS